MGDCARPLVSVILPTRNRRDRLPLALDSVLAQEGLGKQFDLEIAVVDDASCDGTEEVIRRYPNVRYIRLEKQRGVAAARNAGLKATIGPYVAFQDDDDLWLPHKIRLQLPVLREHPDVGVVYSQNLTRFEGQEQLWPSTFAAVSGLVFRALLFDCFCGHPPIVLVRRAAFARAGNFDEELSSHVDYDMWLRLAFHFPFQFVPGAVAVYYASRNGLWQTSMRRGSGAADFRKVVQKALSMLPETPEHRRTKRAARLRAELHIAHDKRWSLAPGEQWAATLDVLRTHPEILCYRWGRLAVSLKARSVIMRSDTPIATGFALGDQLRALGGSARNRWYWTRLTMATVWTEVAIDLERCTPLDHRAAGVAALWAILQNPVRLRMRALPRLVLRAVAAAATQPRRRPPRSSGRHNPQ